MALSGATRELLFGRAATRDDLRETLVQAVPPEAPKRLNFYWGGTGHPDRRDRRRSMGSAVLWPVAGVNDVATAINEVWASADAPIGIDARCR